MEGGNYSNQNLMEYHIQEAIIFILLLIQVLKILIIDLLIMKEIMVMDVEIDQKLIILKADMLLKIQFYT